jgi:ABC-type cobalamin/Fe3+-siderophores transport system ATPase subunit
MMARLPMPDPLLHSSAVSFAYGDQSVLRDVSIDLEAGEVVALLGPNGSGKSTLIKCLLGHLPIAGGAIHWDGRDITTWRRRDLARVVAYLPQAPGFEPEQRVIDVLRLGRAPYWGPFGLESPADVQAIRGVVARLELAEWLGRRMDEVSGGQRQMVFVGRALVQEPQALLLDEPNTFLDLRHQIDLLRLLRDLARERSIGVLLASHDLNLAAAFADRLVLLGDGRVAAAGAADEVLRPDVLGRVFGVQIERIDRGPGRAPVVLPVTGDD